MTKTKIATLIIIFFFFLPISSMAQLKSDAEILQQIQGRIYDGNKWILRDIASFLDKPTSFDRALRTLQYMTCFEKNEFDWSEYPDKARFYDFFYKNQDKLFFDYTIGAWCVTPLEKTQMGDFLIKTLAYPPAPVKMLKNAIQNTKIALETGDTALFTQSIPQLAKLRNPEAWQHLLQLAENKNALNAAPFPKGYPFKAILLNNLKKCPDDKALKIMFDWIEKKYVTAEEAEIPLSELSNHYIHKVEPKAMIDEIKTLYDSLGSLDALKLHGFQQICPTMPYFYDDIADFYGDVLHRSVFQPWARNNAIEGLMASHHPRSLYYLSTRVYRNRFDADTTKPAHHYLNPYTKPIEERISLKLMFTDKDGATVESSTDHEWLLNYVRYWAIHWKDYEWDEKRGIFINKNKSETIADAYDRMFKKLTSSNDSIAESAFRSLTEGNATEIQSLAEQFRQTVRSFNPSLPSFKNKTLEQLNLLVDYCRDNGFEWKPSPNLEAMLSALHREIMPNVRYGLENKMIKELTIDDLTVLEYEGLLNENKRDFSFSISRILDALYSKNWNLIENNTEILKFFLKKSALFSKIGTVGACNSYYLKCIPLNPKLQSGFGQIAAKEIDDDITDQIKFILEKNNEKKPLGAENEPTSSEKFEESLMALQNSETVSIEQLNMVVFSKNYNPDLHKNTCINAINKLKPLNNLRRLNPIVKFSIKDDFRYFEKLPLTEKEFVGILRLFNGDDPYKILTFLNEKSQKMPENEKGSFFNDALRTDWMRRYLNRSAQKDTLLISIQNRLQYLLDTKEDLSEFEENNAKTILFMLANIGRPTSEKIRANAASDANKSLKYNIEREILTDLKFSELSDVVPILHLLSPDEQGLPGYLFLTKDFGLPPFEYDNPDEKALLLKNLKELSEPEVYKFYLRKFGVLFEDSISLSLDFDKINEIFDKDLLNTFAGRGSERRDWYVFAIVKVLEHHFKTSLGFHEKLNENQSFFSYKSNKRALVWSEYLMTNNLTKPLKFAKSWNKIQQ